MYVRYCYKLRVISTALSNCGFIIDAKKGKIIIDKEITVSGRFACMERTFKFISWIWLFRGQCNYEYISKSFFFT